MGTLNDYRIQLNYHWGHKYLPLLYMLNYALVNTIQVKRTINNETNNNQWASLDNNSGIPQTTIKTEMNPIAITAE